MYRIASASLLALTCIAGAAAAQQNPPRTDDAARPHPILRMDVDNDGQITLDAALASPMARADADGDGFVTRDETIAATVERATTRARAMFDRIDAGNEGRIALAACRNTHSTRRACGVPSRVPAPTATTCFRRRRSPKCHPAASASGTAWASKA